jgi:hypothetical protein
MSKKNVHEANGQMQHNAKKFVYVCVCVCVYVYVCVFGCVCVYVSVCMCEFVVNTGGKKRVCLYVYLCVCMCICVSLVIYMCTGGVDKFVVNTIYWPLCVFFFCVFCVCTGGIDKFVVNTTQNVATAVTGKKKNLKNPLYGGVYHRILWSTFLKSPLYGF